MRYLLKRASLILALLMVALPAWAVTKAEVEAFVHEAVRYFHQHGPEKAFAEFQKRDGLFRRGELYIFAADLTGRSLANGLTPKLVGNNLVEMNLKDANGKPFAQMLVDTAKQGGGWVEYHWLHPVERVVRPKASYVVLVNDRFFIAAGMYQ